MPEYLSPGVYVEEVDRGPKPIEGVGTAMAAFVGFTEKAELVREIDGELVVENLLNKPQLVTNWTQYVERFGSFVPGITLPQSVYGYFTNGGSRCYIVSVRTFPKAEATLMNAQGKPALVVRARQAGVEGMKMRVRISDLALPAPAKKAKEGEEAPEAEAPGGENYSFTLRVEKEATTGGWKPLETVSGVRLQTMAVDGEKQVAVAYKNNKLPRFIELVVLEPASLEKVMPREQEQTLTIEKKLLEPPAASEFRGDVSERKGLEGLEVLDDVTMVTIPDLMTRMPGEKLNLDMVKAVQGMMIAHCERMGDRVAILDAPPDLSPQEVKKWRMEVTGFDSSYAALYYPWIKVMDPATDLVVSIPASGHTWQVFGPATTIRAAFTKPPQMKLCWAPSVWLTRPLRASRIRSTRLASTASGTSPGAASGFGALARSPAIPPGAISMCAACSIMSRNRLKAARSGWCLSPITASCGRVSRGMSRHSCVPYGVMALCSVHLQPKPSM
jgi:uncharacterized protein